MVFVCRNRVGVAIRLLLLQSTLSSTVGTSVLFPITDFGPLQKCQWLELSPDSPRPLVKVLLGGLIGAGFAASCLSSIVLFNRQPAEHNLRQRNPYRRHS